MKRRHFIWTGVTAAVAAAGFGLWRTAGQPTSARTPDTARGPASASAQLPVLQVGQQAEPLWSQTLPDLQGQAHPLSQWRGRPVVVNFWATWCAPCVREMPALQALSEKHEDVQFIGIGIDSADNIRAFLKKVPVSYPIVVVETGGVDLLRRLGNAQGGLPYTMILDEEGRVKHQILGEIEAEDLTRRLAG